MRHRLAYAARNFVIRRRCQSVVLFIMLLADTANADPESIGRLFFTPEYRGLLESARRTDESGRGSPLHLDGVVMDSHGGVTVWIDHRVWREGSVSVAPNVPARAMIQARGGAETSLRVGESLDPTTADIGDRLAGGRIVVRKQ